MFLSFRQWDQILRLWGWPVAACALSLLLECNLNATCIATDYANLRSSPSLNAAITWKPAQFTPLKVIKTQKNWVQVQDMDGVMHWAHETVISSRLKCLAIRGDFAFLRTGPSTQQPLARPFGRAEKYQSFQRILLKGDWWQIKSRHGHKAWVHKSLIWFP